MWQLTAKIGRHKGASWPIGSEPLLLGRGTGCTVVIRDPGVSREHARIRLVDGEVHFEDLGSSNGSMVNGSTVRHATLSVGDEVVLGGVTFVVSRVRTRDKEATPTHGGTTVVDLRVLQEARLQNARSRVPAGPRDFSELLAVHALNTTLAACDTRDAVLERAGEFARETLGAVRFGWLGEGVDPARSELSWLTDEEQHWALAACGNADVVQARSQLEDGALLAIPVRLAGSRMGAIVIGRPVQSDEDAEHVLALGPALGRAVAPYLHAIPESNTRDAATRDQSMLVGESVPMEKLRGVLSMAARAEIPVLIHGETGTGKELCAQYLHVHSSRADGPFVPLNCATIPEEIFESEFFGHEKGAFTGAVAAKPGLLGQARGGILFLDEIAELSPQNQARLLRAIETGRYRPVGAVTERETDAWVIAASNRDLMEAVEFGDFREDLFYRLAVVEVSVPTLAERRGDIPLLIERSLRDMEQDPSQPPLLDAGGLAHVASRDWPGNVRELRNFIQRVAALTAERPVSLTTLEALRQHGARTRRAPGVRVDEIERDHIAQVMDQYGGRMAAAAEALGIHRNTLRRKRKQYGL